MDTGLDLSYQCNNCTNQAFDAVEFIMEFDKLSDNTKLIVYIVAGVILCLCCTCCCVRICVCCRKGKQGGEDTVQVLPLNPYDTTNVSFNRKQDQTEMMYDPEQKPDKRVSKGKQSMLEYQQMAEQSASNVDSQENDKDTVQSREPNPNSRPRLQPSTSTKKNKSR